MYSKRFIQNIHQLVGQHNLLNSLSFRASDVGMSSRITIGGEYAFKQYLYSSPAILSARGGVITEFEDTAFFKQRGNNVADFCRTRNRTGGLLYIIRAIWFLVP